MVGWVPANGGVGRGVGTAAADTGGSKDQAKENGSLARRTLSLRQDFFGNN